MGQRGPIGNPSGIRAQRERKRAKEPAGAVAASKALAMPGWLPATAAGTWESVVRDLHAAGVALAAIDAHAVGFYVLCIEGARVAASVNPNLVARFSRDAIAWGNLIGATPAARARLGIKADSERPENPWQALKGFSSGIQELDAILLQPRISRVKTQ